MTIKKEPTNIIARLDRAFILWLERHPVVAKMMYWVGPIENRKKLLRLTGALALINIILIGVSILVAS